MKHALSVTSILLLAACGKPAAPTNAPATTPAATCEAAFARSKVCEELFVPALVDMRIKNDMPSGIAGQGATPEGRAALVTQAQAEWAADSTPANMTQHCAQITAQPSPALDQVVASMNDCQAEATCETYVPCHISAMETFMKSMQPQPAQPSAASTPTP